MAVCAPEKVLCRVLERQQRGDRRRRSGSPSTCQRRETLGALAKGGRGQSQMPPRARACTVLRTEKSTRCSVPLTQRQVRLVLSLGAALVLFSVSRAPAAVVQSARLATVDEKAERLLILPAQLFLLPGCWVDVGCRWNGCKPEPLGWWERIAASHSDDDP